MIWTRRSALLPLAGAAWLGLTISISHAASTLTPVTGTVTGANAGSGCVASGLSRRAIGPGWTTKDLLEESHYIEHGVIHPPKRPDESPHRHTSMAFGSHALGHQCQASGRVGRASSVQAGHALGHRAVIVGAVDLTPVIEEEAFLMGFLLGGD